MNQFANNPNLKNVSGEQTIKRYVHQPFTIEHHGINASISEHGKITISQVKKSDGENVELATMEFSASFVYKLQNLVEMTRKIVYLPLKEATGQPKAEDSAK